MNIALIGFLGSGRTSVGTLLAQSRDATFIEMSDVIQGKKAASADMPDALFNADPIAWKEREMVVARSFAKKRNCVIATTGGIVENSLNIMYLRSNPHGMLIVYLCTKPEVLTERLLSLYDGFAKRGAKRVMEHIMEHFTRRDMLYRSSADIIIATDNREPSEVAAEIQTSLQTP